MTKLIVGQVYRLERLHVRAGQRTGEKSASPVTVTQSGHVWSAFVDQHGNNGKAKNSDFKETIMTQNSTPTVSTTADSTMKVVLVGRHVSDLPANIQVVATENILWATDFDACWQQVKDLLGRAQTAGAGKILLQNVPGILASVLIRAAYDDKAAPSRFGVIISQPGPRLAGVTETYTFPFLAGYTGEKVETTAVRAVSFANGRAKVSVLDNRLTVTVDPVSAFVFDHIEWF